MTSTEATNLSNALNRISLAFPASSNVQKYITRWKIDCTGFVNGSFGPTENLANVSENGVLVCTVAALPLGPVANDEAIVTDATVTTDGSIVAGGGSNRVLVRFNGTNWTIV